MNTRKSSLQSRWNINFADAISTRRLSNELWSFQKPSIVRREPCWLRSSQSNTQSILKKSLHCSPRRKYSDAGRGSFHELIVPLVQGVFRNTGGALHQAFNGETHNEGDAPWHL